MRLFAIALISVAISASVASADVSTARNFYQYSDRVLTAGQPSQDILENVSDDGIEVVISVVPEYESVFNPRQGEILAEQGIEYIHVPVAWTSPTSEEFDRFIAAMDSVGERKVLVHCWANARASALVYAHRAINAPETQADELENLKTVWSDVAGYNLDNNTTWSAYLDENIKRLK